MYTDRVRRRMRRGKIEDIGEVYLAQDSDFVNVNGYWIYRGSELEIEIPHIIQGEEITSYAYMFHGSGSYLATPVTRVVSNNKNVTNMTSMFRDFRATSLDLSSFDTSSVTTMFYMFRFFRATSLDLSSFDTSSVTTMGGMFQYSQATSLDLSSFDTSNVTDMNSMFADSRATSLDLSSFDTSRVTNMASMFSNSQATTGYARTQADADKFNSSSNKPEGLVFKAVYKDGVYLAQDSDFVNVNGYWVYKGEPLEVDITDFVNSKNLTSTRYMFSGSSTYGATAVKRVVLGKSSVTDMYAMFNNSKATSLDLSSFDTSRVTNMIYMFYDSRATSLDLSSFDTSRVTYMSSMFYASQATSLDLSSFDTSSVTTMGGMSYMFYNSQATSLDLSSFDTSRVTNMSYMFRGSQATSLDLSSFDTSSVTNMSGMFSNSQATTGYARTQADADKFNSSSNKPERLVFTVKTEE